MFRVYARSWKSTTTDGAECALSTPFHWDGSRWITRNSFVSGGEGWLTSFVWRSGSSEARQIPRPLRRPGFSRVLTPWQHAEETQRALRKPLREVYLERVGAGGLRKKL